MIYFEVGGERVGLITIACGIGLFWAKANSERGRKVCRNKNHEATSR